MGCQFQERWWNSRKSQAGTWLAVYGERHFLANQNRPSFASKHLCVRWVPVNSTNQEPRSMTFSTSPDLNLAAIVLGLTKLFLNRRNCYRADWINIEYIFDEYRKHWHNLIRGQIRPWFFELTLSLILRTKGTFVLR